jgi:hypothetical protein
MNTELVTVLHHRSVFMGPGQQRSRQTLRVCS